MNYKTLPELISDGDSHVGLTRAHNEDSWLDRGAVGLWVIADGMGGLARGEKASGMIVDRLARLDLPDDLDDAVSVVCNALESVNAELRADMDGQISGSTVVVLLVRQRRFAAVWAGDSRLYKFASGVLHRISKDHSIVEQLVDAGAISQEQARNHPMSNRVTRAIGTENRIEFDIIRGKLQAGDRFLLCTDGLHGMVENSVIEKIVRDGEPASVVTQLIDAALKGGGKDNVSVIVVDIDAGNDLDTTL